MSDAVEAMNPGVALSSVKLGGLLFGLGRLSDDILRVGRYTYTRTASAHLASRPYRASSHLVDQIISTGRGVPD